jgi:hypothetical protein
MEQFALGIKTKLEAQGDSLSCMGNTVLKSVSKQKAALLQHGGFFSFSDETKIS